MNDRRLAAILAADVVGYSRLVSADEAGALARLAALRRDVIELNITRHSGRLFKIMGDGFLAEFASAVQAVTCAIAIQKEVEEAAMPLDDGRKMRLRIGIHVGDVMVDGDDLMGDGVNIAARLESIAVPGSISISRAVHDQVRDRMEVSFDDKGEIALKNIARPVQVFAIAGPKVTAVVAEAKPALALPDKPSIAVLPFQNMSGDPEQEYFADGMVEDIITALSRKRNMFVIARNSSFTYKGKTVDIKQVGRELGVRYVLEGSVRKAGGRLRITGQLIDASTNAHLWADKFDGELDDIFDLQDRITASVIGAISPHLDRAEIDRVKHKPTSSLKAYDCYLQGLAEQRIRTKEGSDRALMLFRRAIELDPDFALAYASAASWFGLRKIWDWPSPEMVPGAANGYIKSALALGKDDPMVLVQVSNALSDYIGDVEAAVAHLERAIELDPNLAAAWLWAGWGNIWLGNHKTAFDYFQRMLRLSPLDPASGGAKTGSAYSCFLQGRYEEAAVWADRALLDHSESPGAQRMRLASRALLFGRDDVELTRFKLNRPNDRVSETRLRAPYRRDEDIAKLERAYRLAGMPE